MTPALVSQSWFRVAPLRPCLVNGLKIVRHPVRDQIWHVLVEPASGSQLRLNPAAYAFVGRCEGEATVAELWESLLAEQANDAPTQDDLLGLLAKLFHAGMVQFDAAPHLSLLFSRRVEDGRQRRRAFVNPLMLRMRLLDPTRLLDRLTPVSTALASWVAFAVWVVCVSLAALACAVYFPQLKADALRLIATPSSYAIAWVCYPIVKALHELGHAMAVRQFGGAVHEMGISLVLLTPAPYVDATAANAFFLRRQRALVSAAGILVELALASGAIFVWATVSPGVVRDAALVVLLICSVSTLLFNGNPLLRLDGYYLLCDSLDLPNLAPRSQAWWAGRLRRWIFGEGRVPESVIAGGELKWLVAYAPAAWTYRVALFVGLAFWVGHQSWLLGWLAVLALLIWLALTGINALRRSLRSGAEGGLRWRATAATSVAVIGAITILFAFPAPSSVVAHGVVWPADHAHLRAGSAGFIGTAIAADGSLVRHGDVVLALQDPALAAERERRASEQAGLLAQQYHALLQNPARAIDLAEDIARNEAELTRTDEQVAQLEVRSRTQGRLVLPRAGDLPGSFAQRGALLGYVLEPVPANVRLVLQDEDLLRVRNRIRSIEVRVTEAPLQAHRAALQHEVAGATRALPSAALGDRHGGPIAVDPADKDGLRALAPVFLLDVAVAGIPSARIGGRAWVKLILDDEPLGLQAMHRLRQLLVKQFNPTGQI